MKSNEGAGAVDARRTRRQRGSATVEFVVVLPVLLLIAGSVIAGGRAWLAHAGVEQLAESAARQASISRTADQAQSSALELVRRDAAAGGLPCMGGVEVSVDTSGFAVPVGQPASVSATVRCRVGLSDLLLPGIPGTVDASASATSVLDRYRARE